MQTDRRPAQVAARRTPRWADTGPRRDRDPVPAFRAALLLLCVVLSLLTDSSGRVFAVLGLLAALTVGTALAPRSDTHLLPVGLLESGVAGVGIVLTGGPQSPVLPYLLAPGVCVVVGAGLRGALLVSGAAAGTVLLADAAARAVHGAHGPMPDLASATCTWLLLSLAAAALVSRAVQVPRTGEPGDRYDEARVLLEQLRAVSRKLPGGLDVVSAAEVLLAEATAASGATRSAVLVQPAGGSLVPAAVRGTTRVPWRAPLTEPGPLRTAWETRRPVVDRRPGDVDGRRCGSVLAVVPLVSGGQSFGLIVLESYGLDAFSDAVVRTLEEQALRSSLRVETAMLFEEVRSTVTVAERDRLAREIHDGVGQDLAFLGYCLDDLRLSAVKVDGRLGEKVAEVRSTLTGLIGDLRLSITDLRTSVANDRGLGSALSSYVRAAGNGHRLRVHLTLAESAFRLPADQEVLLVQLAQAVAQEARRTAADDLWVELSVDPPRARLTLEHDGGAGSVTLLEPWWAALHAAGGAHLLQKRPGGGTRACITLGGEVP